MTTPTPAAHDLQDASIRLDGHLVLRPHTTAFEHYYVERPRVESELVREAARASQTGRPFEWFFTGHTGAGKSTELARITADSALTRRYIAHSVDLVAEFDIHNIEYTDLILAMGKACAFVAEDNNVPVPQRLRRSIEDWGAEVVRERETFTKTEGVATLAGLKLPFFNLSEEVRSGGTQREVIRKKISTNVRGFLDLVDALAASIKDFTGLEVLVVLDGLDHVSVEPCLRLLHDHFETITEPRIAKIFVIPLPMLNTPFLATVGHHFSTVPNIKVFYGPGSPELDRDGLSFFREVIARYVSLDRFEPQAFESLFRLSAGILRDMIRNTGDACGHAADEAAPQVKIEHVERVWERTMRFYRSQLLKNDYEVLRRVDQEPYPKGIDGVPPLLHSKAVVFYPNGEGWYGVHPAVRRLLDE